MLIVNFWFLGQGEANGNGLTDSGKAQVALTAERYLSGLIFSYVGFSTPVGGESVKSALQALGQECYIKMNLKFADADSLTQTMERTSRFVVAKARGGTKVFHLLIGSDNRTPMTLKRPHQDFPDELSPASLLKVAVTIEGEELTPQIEAPLYYEPVQNSL